MYHDISDGKSGWCHACRLVIMHVSPPHCKLAVHTLSALPQQHAELNKGVRTCKKKRKPTTDGPPQCSALVRLNPWAHLNI